MNDDDIVKIYAALSDKTRLSIIRKLINGDEKACSHLLEDVNLSRSTFSHHIKILLEAGLIEQKYVGGYKYFWLIKDRLKDSFAEFSTE